MVFCMLLPRKSLRRLSSLRCALRHTTIQPLYPPLQTLAIRTRDSAYSSMSMLQKAVDKNNATKSISCAQLSRPTSSSTTKPILSPATGNNQPSQLVPSMNSFTAKRASSSLARTFSGNSGFEENIPYSRPMAKPTNTPVMTTTQNFFDFDGATISIDDLDSDWETEEAKPLPAKISYPNVASSLPTPSISKMPSVKRADTIAAVPSASLERAFDWSSSPAAHYKFPNKLSKFEYQSETILEEATKPTRNVSASQKRRLPKEWQAAEEVKQPWDFTSGTLKKQQKRVKTSETDESRAAAIEKKKKSHVARIFLSDEQQHVLNMVVDQGKSVFFTGSAGTGKSVLLREIIASMKRKYSKESDRVAITASTGLAACNIGGITLHSFSGIGLGKGSVQDMVKKIKKNAKSKTRWLRTKVLIIDEVSMVDGDLYDKLEAIARQIRNNGRPFGGIQLIITGDFFQLPPVPEGGRQARFAFNAESWPTTIEKTIGLHKVFRQKDPVFAAMLNQMREGYMDEAAIAKFRSLNRPLRFDDGIDATELFSTRHEVEQANRVRLASLEGEMQVYEANDGGTVTDLEWRNKLLSNVMAPERIALKKGAQVMLIKNMDETLVNGSLGKVIGFMSERQFASYQEMSSSQIPATQGGTLFDEADLAYQALTSKKPSNADVSSGQRLPIVRFAIADGTTRDLLCRYEQWAVEQPNGEIQASRSQIPLILAWALSIHKAQGQTLERVKVNLSRAFEKGQAYVALSRATSMAGLQVIGFEPRKVMAHEAVRTFYAGLTRIENQK